MFVGTFSGLASAAGIYAWGHSNGFSAAEEKYPAKFEMVQSALIEEKSRNVELQSSNNKFQEDYEKIKARNTELEQEETLNEEKQENLDTAISENLRLPVETTIESDSTMVFLTILTYR